jgi:DNA polymerase epsilon subunit 1
METAVEEFILKRCEGAVSRIIRERKEDLKLPNHLLGYRRLYLKLVFRNVQDLLAVRKDLLPLALANAKKRNAVDAYAEVMQDQANGMNGMSVEMDVDEDAEGELYQASTSRGKGPDKDPREYIIDIREYDVTYYLRAAIDLEIRVGLWYAVTFTEERPAFKQLPERVKRADPVVMAYDIETTKAPLKLSDSTVDQIIYDRWTVLSHYQS